MKTRMCVRCKKETPLKHLKANKPSKYGRMRMCYPCYTDYLRFGSLRNEVIKRDKNRCVVCGMTNADHKKKWNKSITIHHIDGNGIYSNEINNSIENLQTLCFSCHGKQDAHHKETAR